MNFFDKEQQGQAMVKRFFLPICLFIFLAVFAAFYPITGNGFINYDDNDYVTENLHVQAGLTWRQAAWAFANTDAGNWHPLTWLSHMLDCQWYGPNPWGHHLTSVLIHAANAVLVFVVLRAMTGAMWRSLFAALLFGLHPLRVESVAWIAERKDVLSAMFWLLSMWAYIAYARNQKDRPRRAAVNYWIALVCLALGLMSKPMVVTLPLALLLIDCWPLQRMTRDNAARLFLEKGPFFLLAIAGSVIAFLAQRSQGAVIDYLPLSHRLETAVLAYSRYLGNFFVPVNLAVLYPHPAGRWPLSEVLAAAALFVAVSGAVLMAARSRPYCLMGWWWYVLTLLPVIGVVQIGSQSLADRYTYIPGLGLAVILTWGVCDLAAKLPGKRLMLGTAATAAVLACVALTRHQIRFWKNSGTLFSHAVAVTDNSYVARKALADFDASQGRTEEAIALYREALKMDPGYEGAHLNLGAVFSQLGDVNDAMAEFKQAIQLKPDDPSAYNDLGAVVAATQLDEGMSLFQKAIQLEPGYADAHKNLGQALAIKGRSQEAVAQYQESLRLRPNPDVNYLLALALEKLGRNGDAIIQLDETLKVRPNYPPALQALQRMRKNN